ncbi:Alpha/Beta hydrolase protein [Hypoxylon rubiginosum]|uniref:Alpha/Beta hydrolase protein n=1 Tax=Hypoxylon rubiginosum TaxID=110542 RepID=A0ACC0D8V0_9PEZI|nr:Alpha/Beta hydrolase protein [Hypoxylon rubiginosum]
MPVTRRSDLSLLYKILRTFIRPMRPHLVTPKGKYPAGSPRLTKHPRRVGEVTITEREVLVPSTGNVFSTSFDTRINTQTENIWIYDFHPPTTQTSSNSNANTNANSPTQTIYYFAGGSFQSPPSSSHWTFCAHIAAALGPSGSRVVLVSYPLAPHSPACDSLPLLRRWLARTLGAEIDTDGVTLAGDSSGANIALSLALWCAEQRAFAAAGTSADAMTGYLRLRRVKGVLVISPPVNLRALNGKPKVVRADAVDPVLGKWHADRVAEVWGAGSDVRDPYLSPGLADLKDLKTSKIAVNGVVGTADVLAPDALAFMEKCEAEGVDGEWLVWEGQMHCFPLAACYGLREGKEAREWILKTLQ